MFHVQLLSSSFRYKTGIVALPWTSLAGPDAALAGYLPGRLFDRHYTRKMPGEQTPYSDLELNIIGPARHLEGTAAQRRHIGEHAISGAPSRKIDQSPHKVHDWPSLAIPIEYLRLH
jgi:hypothetical protein